MVTFTTDYWAPALDSKARRRMTESEERIARSFKKERNSLTSLDKPKRNNSLPVIDGTDPNQTPFVSKSQTTITIPPPHQPENNPSNLDKSSNNNSNNNNYVSDHSDRSTKLSAINGIPNDTFNDISNDNSNNGQHSNEPKRMTIVKSLKNLLNAEHKSGQSTSVNEKDELDELPESKISTLKEILNPKLDLDKQSNENGREIENVKVDPESMLIKKYGVCEKGVIGKGATAVVRLAHKNEQTNEEKTFAVKEFRKRRKNETEKEYIKKLTSEFCISSSLQHVNVVKTVDLVQDEHNNWCEVMEYCPCGDLYAAIKAGYMTSVEINCFFKQLIMGVGYLHSMGVAHRDIKPENLLLNEKGHLKITDFGVSDVFKTCWEGSAHMSKGLCGSEPYIAPEQFETKEYDARLVDVWACGIVYYCMIYQGIPFRMAAPTDPNYANYLETKNVGLYEPFEKLPRGCRDLLYKILEPDPKKRYTIEKIKRDPWFKEIESCTESGSLSQKHNHIPPKCLKEIQNNNNNNDENNNHNHNNNNNSHHQ